ncbi:hypothetical protein ANN_03019 [Periplaneta americana]|uniref:DUF4817 domain-containing protein n=1 Tax=Periplaneta americana TaxID=6978 RepID=A0ABQ8TZ24_PERAM|nr:hypothetical protein ANN_03019 [Periplaneta americana]
MEEHVFIIRVYCKTDSIHVCQERFVERFGGNRHPPSKFTIWSYRRNLKHMELYWTDMQRTNDTGNDRECEGKATGVSL